VGQRGAFRQPPPDTGGVEHGRRAHGQRLDDDGTGHRLAPRAARGVGRRLIGGDRAGDDGRRQEPGYAVACRRSDDGHRIA